MNTTLAKIRKPLRLIQRPWATALLGLAVLLLLWGLARQAGLRRGADSDEPVFAAVRGPLTISLNESGTVQSREKVVVRSEVAGRNTIIYLVEEGRQVREGDLLVQLDASRLEEQRLEQDIRVQNAEASFIQARENLEVIRNQAQADIEEAELRLRFAQLDLDKYEEGDYPSELQKAEAEITMADEELRRAQDTLEWSRRLAADGYLTRSELQADELALKRRQLDLELARNRLDVLQEFTHTRNLEKLRSDIKQAEMALERVRLKAAADVVRAEADARAREAEYQQQVNRLERHIDQIAKCRIAAPSAGMVVYATTVAPRRWGQAQPFEVGQEVTERQELIHLPAAAAMMAEIKVQEASLTKIRTGLTARITVDALPGQVFRGRLDRIGVLPDSANMWLNPDLKLYNCDVLIEGDGSLRPGMSCRVEVLIEEFEDAVYVPLQAVVRVGGQSTVYVRRPRGGIEPQPVRVGLDNGRMVHILEGLDEGEPVLLAPPLPDAALREERRTWGREEGLEGSGAEDSGRTPPTVPDAPAGTERPRPRRPEGETEGSPGGRGEGRARPGAAP